MSEHTPPGEPLDIPLSDEEVRQWRESFLRVDSDIWVLTNVALQAGAANEQVHPSDSTLRIARFIGPDVFPDRDGLVSELPILRGKYFEVTFAYVDGRITDIRALAFVVPSTEENKPTEYYELSLKSEYPKISRLPHRGFGTLTPISPTVSDVMSFGGTVGALWEENAPRSM